MLSSRPEIRLHLPEVVVGEIGPLQEPELVSQIKRSLGLLFNAAIPVSPMASAVVRAAVA
ncbi:MAG TPA: hypothetical protein VGE67_03870 [Haloferula sp.]